MLPVGDLKCILPLEVVECTPILVPLSVVVWFPILLVVLAAPESRRFCAHIQPFEFLRPHCLG